jgi:hypothetical protein
MNEDGTSQVRVEQARVVGPFAMDQTNVYFTFADGNLAPQYMAQDKLTGGGRVDMMNLSGGKAPDTIGTDGRYLWFADPNGSRIVRLAVGGSTQAGTVIYNVPANDAVVAIFGDGTYVYWLQDVDYRVVNNGTNCGAVVLYRKLSTDGTTSAPEALSTYSTGPQSTSCAATATWDQTAVVFSDGIGYMVLMAL